MPTPTRPNGAAQPTVLAVLIAASAFCWTKRGRNAAEGATCDHKKSSAIVSDDAHALQWSRGLFFAFVTPPAPSTRDKASSAFCATLRMPATCRRSSPRAWCGRNRGPEPYGGRGAFSRRAAFAPCRRTRELQEEVRLRYSCCQRSAPAKDAPSQATRSILPLRMTHA